MKTKFSGLFHRELLFQQRKHQVLIFFVRHLFAVASSAYSSLSKTGESQVVVISGESGSGKTESTKLVMQYLAAVNKAPSNLVTEQILEASPLLESFGNAKTVRNDNSSRFGKYLEIQFNKYGFVSLFSISFSSQSDFQGCDSRSQGYRILARKIQDCYTSAG